MKKLSENIGQNHRWGQWLTIGIIVFSTTVVYYNSINVPFILDDIGKIVENPDIKELNNLKTKLVYPYSEQYHNFSRNDPSRPLIYLTFTLNYYFGKLNPFGYHLFNLIIHIFNAILLFFLTKKIVFYLYKRDSIVFPFFIALFFAIHPINTSVVTYIFSRSDILTTFFYISALMFFIKTFEKNKKLYVLSLLFFVLSLFSKQIAVTLPAILLVFDYIFLSDFNIRKTIKKKHYHIPFWVLLFIYLLFRYFYLGSIGDVEAISTSWDRYSYFIIQPYIILKYFKLLLIPIGLCMDHLINSIEVLEPKTIVSFISLAVIFLLTYVIYRKKTNSSKIILFCVLWFFITLSPTSSFFPTTSALVENRLYLSSIGFYFFITFLYFSIFKINFTEELNLNRNKILVSIISFHIVLLGYGTIKRNQLYKNPILLWQDVIQKYPNNSRAHYNLGLLLDDSKRYAEAEKEYREAIKIYRNHADVHNNLGILLQNSKRYAEAEKEYREAIKIDPNEVNAHYNLSGLLYKLKKYEEAEKECKEVMRIDPNNVDVHNNLGNLYYALKEYNKALQEFEIALKLLPGDQYIKNKISFLQQLMLKNQNK